MNVTCAFLSALFLPAMATGAELHKPEEILQQGIESVAAPAKSTVEPLQVAENTAVPAAPAVELNRASAAELAARLPGIGPALAANIVSYRETHGPFSAVESLLAVKGIGQRTVERLRSMLTVADNPAARSAEREARAAVQDVVSIAKRNAAAATR